MFVDIESYLRTAAWSSTDENGEPLDSYQFSDAAKIKLEKDLSDFVEYIEKEYPTSLVEYETEHDGTESQFAHDFWLTRNGHGAGFWDRGLGEIGERFTTAAKTFGSCDLYLNEETLEIEVM